MSKRDSITLPYMYQSPKITIPSKTLVVRRHKSYTFHAEIYGTPRPTVSWFIGRHQVVKSENFEVTIDGPHHKLDVRSVPEDINPLGLFVVAVNPYGVDRKKFDVKVYTVFNSHRRQSRSRRRDRSYTTYNDEREIQVPIQKSDSMRRGRSLCSLGSIIGGPRRVYIPNVDRPSSTEDVFYDRASDPSIQATLDESFDPATQTLDYATYNSPMPTYYPSEYTKTLQKSDPTLDQEVGSYDPVEKHSVRGLYRASVADSGFGDRSRDWSISVDVSGGNTSFSSNGFSPARRGHWKSIESNESLRSYSSVEDNRDEIVSPQCASPVCYDALSDSELVYNKPRERQLYRFSGISNGTDSSTHITSESGRNLNKLPTEEDYSSVRNNSRKKNRTPNRVADESSRFKTNGVLKEPFENEYLKNSRFSYNTPLQYDKPAVVGASRHLSSEPVYQYNTLNGAGHSINQLTDQYRSMIGARHSVIQPVDQYHTVIGARHLSNRQVDQYTLGSVTNRQVINPSDDDFSSILRNNPNVTNAPDDAYTRAKKAASMTLYGRSPSTSIQQDPTPKSWYLSPDINKNDAASLNFGLNPSAKKYSTDFAKANLNEEIEKMTQELDQRTEDLKALAVDSELAPERPPRRKRGHGKENDNAALDNEVPYVLNGLEYSAMDTIDTSGRKEMPGYIIHKAIPSFIENQDEIHTGFASTDTFNFRNDEDSGDRKTYSSQAPPIDESIERATFHPNMEDQLLIGPDGVKRRRSFNKNRRSQETEKLSSRLSMPLKSTSRIYHRPKHARAKSEYSTSRLKRLSVSRVIEETTVSRMEEVIKVRRFQSYTPRQIRSTSFVFEVSLQINDDEKRAIAKATPSEIQQNPFVDKFVTIPGVQTFTEEMDYKNSSMPSFQNQTVDLPSLTPVNDMDSRKQLTSKVYERTNFEVNQTTISESRTEKPLRGTNIFSSVDPYTEEVNLMKAKPVRTTVSFPVNYAPNEKYEVWKQDPNQLIGENATTSASVHPFWSNSNEKSPDFKIHTEAVYLIEPTNSPSDMPNPFSDPNDPTLWRGRMTPDDTDSKRYMSSSEPPKELTYDVVKQTPIGNLPYLEDKGAKLGEMKYLHQPANEKSSNKQMTSIEPPPELLLTGTNSLSAETLPTFPGQYKVQDNLKYRDYPTSANVTSKETSSKFIEPPNDSVYLTNNQASTDTLSSLPLQHTNVGERIFRDPPKSTYEPKVSSDEFGEPKRPQHNEPPETLVIVKGDPVPTMELSSSGNDYSSFGNVAFREQPKPPPGQISGFQVSENNKIERFPTDLEISKPVKSKSDLKTASVEDGPQSDTLTTNTKYIKPIVPNETTTDQRHSAFQPVYDVAETNRDHIDNLVVGQINPEQDSCATVTLIPTSTLEVSTTESPYGNVQSVVEQETFEIADDADKLKDSHEPEKAMIQVASAPDDYEKISIPEPMEYLPDVVTDNMTHDSVGKTMQTNQVSTTTVMEEETRWTPDIIVGHSDLISSTAYGSTEGIAEVSFQNAEGYGSVTALDGESTSELPSIRESLQYDSGFVDYPRYGQADSKEQPEAHLSKTIVEPFVSLDTSTNSPTEKPTEATEYDRSVERNEAKSDDKVNPILNEMPTDSDPQDAKRKEEKFSEAKPPSSNITATPIKPDLLEDERISSEPDNRIKVPPNAPHEHTIVAPELSKTKTDQFELKPKHVSKLDEQAGKPEFHESNGKDFSETNPHDSEFNNEAWINEPNFVPDSVSLQAGVRVMPGFGPEVECTEPEAMSDVTSAPNKLFADELKYKIETGIDETMFEDPTAAIIPTFPQNEPIQPTFSAEPITTPEYSGLVTGLVQTPSVHVALPEESRVVITEQKTSFDKSYHKPQETAADNGVSQLDFNDQSQDVLEDVPQPNFETSLNDSEFNDEVWINEPEFEADSMSMEAGPDVRSVIEQKEMPSEQQHKTDNSNAQPSEVEPNEHIEPETSEGDSNSRNQLFPDEPEYNTETWINEPNYSPDSREMDPNSTFSPSVPSTSPTQPIRTSLSIEPKIKSDNQYVETGPNTKSSVEIPAIADNPDTSAVDNKNGEQEFDQPFEEGSRPGFQTNANDPEFNNEAWIDEPEFSPDSVSMETGPGVTSRIEHEKTPDEQEHRADPNMQPEQYMEPTLSEDEPYVSTIPDDHEYNIETWISEPSYLPDPMAADPNATVFLPTEPQIETNQSTVSGEPSPKPENTNIAIAPSTKIAVPAEANIVVIEKKTSFNKSDDLSKKAKKKANYDNKDVGEVLVTEIYVLLQYTFKVYEIKDLTPEEREILKRKLPKHYAFGSYSRNGPKDSSKPDMFVTRLREQKPYNVERFKVVREVVNTK